MKKYKFLGGKISTCDFTKGQIYEAIEFQDDTYFMDDFWIESGYSAKDFDVDTNAVWVDRHELEKYFEVVK